jgi:NitT/TauT family transport system permease protein/taurine transport system permease protein
MEKHRLLQPQLKYALISIATAILIYSVLTNLHLYIDVRPIPVLSVFRPQYVPPPQIIWQRMLEMIHSGHLWQNILVSFFRVMVGYICGAVLGVSTGLLMGWYPTADNYLDPLVQFIRPIPPLAFVTLFILWLGVGELSKILIIVETTAVVTLIPTYQGVKSLPKIYLEAARSLGASNQLIFRRVAFPSTVPHIVGGLRVALGLSWSVIVASEYIASFRGLGYQVIYYQRIMSVSGVVVSIIWIGIMVYLFDTIFRTIFRRVTRWTETQSI